jgi:hypothetical protein
MKRETGYICTYSTATGEGSSWVRAWDEEQASSTVRSMLREHGVKGEIAVRVEPAVPEPAAAAADALT